MTDEPAPVDRPALLHGEEFTTPDLGELNQRFVEAINGRDFDALLATFAPDAVWDREGLGTFEGRKAIRDAVEDWIGSFEDYEQVVEEFRDLGNRVTVGVALARGRPTGGSRLVEFRFAFVARWADGLIERITTHTDVDQARATAERLAEERG